MTMSNEPADEGTAQATPPSAAVGTLRFLERSAVEAEQTRGPRAVDYRDSQSRITPVPSHATRCQITDARLNGHKTSLDAHGFTLIEQPTAVTDWFDAAHVMQQYYKECQVAATALTGASHAFTFDHLIREPGKQTAGGGLDGTVAVTGADRGGGYVNGVHMDYTDNATWTAYLALHGIDEPQDPARVVVLNFWRPILNTAEAQPLAVCDARTVHASDLLETEIFGYGHAGYSWHDIGVAVYEVAASDRHEWYYYSNMTPDETLVFKTYDSASVVGRTCPHGSFTNSTVPDNTPDRRSIELRVLCYIDAVSG